MLFLPFDSDVLLLFSDRFKGNLTLYWMLFASGLRQMKVRTQALAWVLGTPLKEAPERFRDQQSLILHQAKAVPAGGGGFGAELRKSLVQAAIMSWLPPFVWM